MSFFAVILLPMDDLEIIFPSINKVRILRLKAITLYLSKIVVPLE
jgi:hypothetical protein